MTLQRIGLFAVFLVIGIIVWVCVYLQVKTGTTFYKGGNNAGIERNKNPVAFWVVVGFEVAVGLGIIVVLVLFVLGVVGQR